VKEFKYLGYIIAEDLTDDADIQQEIRNLQGGAIKTGPPSRCKYSEIP